MTAMIVATHPWYGETLPLLEARVRLGDPAYFENSGPPKVSRRTVRLMTRSERHRRGHDG